MENNLTILEKIEVFRLTPIAHPHLTAARSKLRLAIRQAVKGTIIFMFGPTGVGKSTLLSHLQTNAGEEFQSEHKDDPGVQPIVLVEASTSEDHRFSWKDFYRQALDELNEPLIDWKLEDLPRGFTRHHRTDSSTPGYKMRRILKSVLEYRKVKVLMIDEAHHIALGTSFDGLFKQLEHIKSFAKLNGTVVALAGTYNLQAFRNLSGQLSRRSIDVHFPRYHAENPDELKMFVNVVATFAVKLPYPCDFDLTEKIEELYTGSLGCVGVLSNWLYKAMHCAHDAGDECLSWSHLENTILTYDQLDKMTSELLEGERLLVQPEDGLARIGVRLGLPIGDAIQASKKSTGSKKKYTGRVGTRKPVRDQVGGGEI